MVKKKKELSKSEKLSKFLLKNLPPQLKRPTKASQSEIDKERKFRERMMKLKHKQRMEQIRAQQEIAYKQDPRFQPQDQDEHTFLNQDFIPPEQETFFHYEEARPLNKLSRFSLRNLANRASSMLPRGNSGKGIRHLPPHIQSEIRRRENPLNAPNIMFADRNILWNSEPTRRNLNLMESEHTKPKAERLRFWNA